jgi:phosphoglycolate phosphatase-like HAD superfamily hydrolase
MYTNNHPKLILFDIDGTLLWPKGAGRASTKLAMMEVFGTVGNIDAHAFGGKTDWYTLVEVLSPEGYDAETIRQRMPTFEDAIARHLTNIIGDFPVQPCPGVLEVVEYLHRHESAMLGLVTGNVAKTAPVKLRAAGLNPDWFPIGAYGSDAMDRNDLPAIALERAIQHYKCAIQPEQVIVIGDTTADIACGRALGAKVIAVKTGFSPLEELEAAKPDFLLEDLTTLLEIVF